MRCLRPQAHDLTHYAQLPGVVRIVGGDDVDLAHDIVLVFTAVGQGREQVDVGIVDDGDQCLPVSEELVHGLLPASEIGFN